MCFSTAKWQREEVQDHKFDFINVDEFYNKSFVLRLKYSLVLLIVLKSVLVYIADIWTAGILLIFDRWSSSVQPAIPFFISKWIYVSCIFISFFLLAWDIKKARHIVKSKDISYAFTNVVAYKHYILRSYSHFCFFSKINNSKRIVDSIAFFVFFTFKGWKRILFAEAPRQLISAITLYSILQSNKSRHYLDFNQYGTDTVQRLAVGLMAFSLLIFTASASMFIFAFLLYIPLLCQIRGNLKEYCCHKIDKRIGELLKKNSKKRIRKRQLEAQAGTTTDFGHFKKKNASAPVETPHRQPTIPKLENNPLPPNLQSQKIIVPEQKMMNFPQYGQNAAVQNYGPKNDHADTINYLPYKNNNTTTYNLSRPGYPQPPYPSKSPPPNAPQHGYNNLMSKSEPILQMHVANSGPIPQIHAANSGPIPQIHAANSGPIPQIHASNSGPIPQIHTSKSVPQIHAAISAGAPQRGYNNLMANSEPIYQIHSANSEPIPQIHAAISGPVPPTSRPIPQAYTAVSEPVPQIRVVPPQPTTLQVVQPMEEPVYDNADIIDDYSDLVDDNYSDRSNSYSDPGNNYNNYSQPVVGMNRNPMVNLAPPKISNSQPPNSQYQPQNQAVRHQVVYNTYAQQESNEMIEDHYYYAQ